MSDPLPFSFKPDWTQPITERLSWLTAVMQSRSGAEQREGLRITPRRQFDIPLMMTGQERTYFDVILARNGGGTWNVPIVHEEISVGPIFVGQTDFPLVTAFRELAVGTKLLLRDEWFSSEIVTITAVHTNSVVTTPTVLAYSAATMTPTFVGVLSDVVTATRHTGRVYTATARFTSLDAARGYPPIFDVPAFPYTMQPSGYNMAFPVWTVPPNSVNALDYGYERMWSVVDGDASLPVYTDKAQRQFTTQKYEFFAVGQEEQHTLRTQLYALHGKLHSVWMPTFNDDLAYGYGYPDPLGLGSATVPGRELCVRFKKDGTPELTSPFHVSPLATTDLAGGVPPEQYDGSDVAYTSFVSLKRLDVDDIEIQHYGTLDGVAMCSVLFRDAPYLRQDGSGQDLATQTYPQKVYHREGGDVTPTNDVASTSPTIADLVAGQAIMTTS